MKISDLVNVIDVEATCWEPASSKPANAISEIIEIGIAVVDTKKACILENHSIMVRPQRSELSQFCMNLTTLTKYDVNCGTTFQDAVRQLAKTFDSKNRVFISWGDYDRKMFEKNCADYKCEYPFGPRHLNLRNCFTLFHGLNSEPDIIKAGDLVNVPFSGTHHRGIDDARNIANLFITMLNRFNR